MDGLRYTHDEKIKCRGRGVILKGLKEKEEAGRKEELVGLGFV